jgi:RNase adapter protein RapZ
MTARPISAAPGTRPLVVVVTGMSGAGKSTALHALEDLGFFCTDNLPTVLAPQAVALCENGGMSRVALGIDARVRAFLGEVGNVLALLENGGLREVQVIFLDASDETLLRRFSETRRRHPLDTSGHDGAGAVLEGVALERERLAGLRARATRVFDTTLLSVHELRRAVIAHFGPAADGAGQRMSTRIVSFGFKYGAPVDADLVFDVRFLENPYFVPGLKNLPGTDPAVEKFVLDLPETQEFLKRALDLLRFVLPKYAREGKSYLTIGVGCTGGRHRSVVVAEQLVAALARDLDGGDITLVHRDVLRKGTGVEATRSPSQAPPPNLAMREEHSELKHALSPLPQPVHQSFRPPKGGSA